MTKKLGWVVTIIASILLLETMVFASEKTETSEHVGVISEIVRDGYTEDGVYYIETIETFEVQHPINPRAVITVFRRVTKDYHNNYSGFVPPYQIYHQEDIGGNGLASGWLQKVSQFDYLPSMGVWRIRCVYEGNIIGQS